MYIYKYIHIYRYIHMYLYTYIYSQKSHHCHHYWLGQSCKARYGGTRRDLKGHELGDPEHQPSPAAQHSVNSLSSFHISKEKNLLLSTAKHC